MGDVKDGSNCDHYFSAAVFQLDDGGSERGLQWDKFIQLKLLLLEYAVKVL